MEKEEMMIGFIDTIPVVGQATVRKSSPSIDPSGVYEWKGQMPGVLTLALKDEVLTGTLVTRGKETPISDAVMQDDQISFSVTSQEFRGVALDFEATVTGDGIRGKVDFVIEAVGKSQALPWVAHKKE